MLPRTRNAVPIMCHTVSVCGNKNLRQLRLGQSSVGSSIQLPLTFCRPSSAVFSCLTHWFKSCLCLSFPFPFPSFALSNLLWGWNKLLNGKNTRLLQNSDVYETKPGTNATAQMCTDTAWQQQALSKQDYKNHTNNKPQAPTRPTG